MTHTQELETTCWRLAATIGRVREFTQTLRFLLIHFTLTLAQSGDIWFHLSWIDASACTSEIRVVPSRQDTISLQKNCIHLKFTKDPSISTCARICEALTLPWMIRTSPPASSSTPGGRVQAETGRMSKRRKLQSLMRIAQGLKTVRM